MRMYVLAGLLLTVSVGLSGCGEQVAGQPRAAGAALKLDRSGCPDFSGAYAFNVPAGDGVSLEGSLLEEFPVEDGNRVPAAQISGLIVQRKTDGLYDWHFLIDEARVMQELGVIREFKQPRYREWYHLLDGPGRDASVARDGEAGHAQRVAALGPRTEIVRTLREGAEMVCRDGWIELPRAYRKPIRLTLGEDGSILGESREIRTVGVTVWCGDGCKDLPIPTGTFTGRLQWPRRDGLHAWRPGDMTGRYVFLRPMDEIEAETAARAEAQQRADALRYASAETIRARIEALAPAGTVVDQVAVRDGKVFVRYTAPVDEQDRLLAKIAGASGDPHAPQDVQHIVTSGHFDVRSVEFTLTDSPVVARETASMATSSAPAIETSPAPVLAALSVAPPEPAPAGIADAGTLKRRAGALFPAGTRIINVRYGGENVTIIGETDSNKSVSDGLRAIDGQGAKPELLRIETTPDRRVRFEILLRRSPLIAG